jgi:hypothetical protein
MDELWRLNDYLQTHPLEGMLAVVGLLYVYYLLNRKSPLSRNLDERLAQLRRDRGDLYNKLRRLK